MTRWPMVSLGDVFTIARGGSPRPIDAFLTDDPNGVNWIMIGDASEGSKFISSTKKRIRRDGVSRSRSVNPGDLLLTNSMSFGKPYILNTPGCIHDGWLVLSPRRHDIDTNFFYHLLGSGTLYKQFLRLAAGAVVKNLNIDLVKGVRVGLPPLPEQRRIADILDRADAIRGKRQASIALTGELLRSAFLEMFGDPGTNPKGWAVKQLGEIAEQIDYGVTASANTEPVGPKFLRITDIQEGRVDWPQVPYCECDTGTAERAQLAPGDIVFARTGATTGKSFWIQECPSRTVFASYLIRVRPGATVVSAYLSEFFQSAGYWGQVRAMAEGAAQPGVNATKLAALRVPIPPVPRQQEFARLSARASTIRARTEASLFATDQLVAALVHEVFGGEFGSSEVRC